MNCDAIVPLAEADLSCPQEPVPTEKKCFHCTCAMCFYLETCVMPPHESVKTFQRRLRGFLNLRCFHNQFFLVRYLGFAHFLMGTGNPASVY